jgi:GMP synthase-like glutamine amidotransferase
MLIGILETGEVHPDLARVHGDYPVMFRRLLGKADPEARFLTASVVRGEMPGHVHAADAWLVTGSRHGVYDGLPWIAPLKAFLRAAIAAGVPVAGVCFGHQILAEALGGRAEKSAKGWGLGVETYRFRHQPVWMAGAGDSYAGLALHQDQVTALPADATVLASSPHCAIAAVAYGDPDRPRAISVQSHPEFTPDYVAGVIALRRGSAIPEATAARAEATLAAPVSGADWARWIIAYFRRACAARAAA